MNQGFAKGTYFDVLSKNKALVIGGVGLAFPILGFIYEYNLLRAFGVNIGMFSDTTDFLISAFKKPLVVCSYFIATLVLVLIGSIQFKYKKLKPGILLNIFVPISLFVILIFLNIYIAQEQIRAIKCTEQFYVELEFKSEKKLSVNKKDLVMISANSRYIFIFQRMQNHTGKTIIVPKEDLLTLVQSPYTLP
jgi:hypothetical protein